MLPAYNPDTWEAWALRACVARHSRWGEGAVIRELSLLPSVARIPQPAQIIRQGPTDSVLASTDLGEMKIPEPMMVPTMIQMPLMRPTCVCKAGAHSASQDLTGQT